MTKGEVLKLALEALEIARPYEDWDTDTRDEAITAIKEALAQPEQRSVEHLEPEYRCCPHDSDCAVHNMPAYPAGPCDCMYENTHNLPPSAVVHEICLALTKRELDKLEHENFGRIPNDSWTNKVLDVYHFFDSNSKAKKLTVLYTTPQVATPRPQRTAAEGEDTRRAWVKLTDDQINQAYADSYKGILLHEAIEAKLKENNNG